MTETVTRDPSAPNRVWASWNLGEKYGNGTALFVGGADVDEFLANLSGIGGTALSDLFVSEWDKQITDTLPSKTPTTPDQAIKNLRGGGLVGQEAQHGETLRCVHGDRVQRSGTSAKGPWTGWFCALPKGSAGACKAIFK